MNTQKLFFFHLPKAGGTSIISALNETSNQTIAPTIENNTFDHNRLAGQYDRFKGYDVYAGHYGRDVYKSVTSGHLVFTNFRHPVYRVASLYRYFRHIVNIDHSALALPHYKAVWCAKNLSFEEFTSSKEENVLIYTSDFHFRQIGRSPWKMMCDEPISAIKDFINGMSCAFVCEYPIQSNALLNKVLGISDVLRLNDTDAHNTGKLITPNSSRNILLRNERDLEIYDFAVNRFFNPSSPSYSAR